MTNSMTTNSMTANSMATNSATTTTMTGAKRVGRSRALAFVAMLSGAILTMLLLPAYGQQEVAPDWYNPWASNATTVEPAHPAVLTPVQLQVTTQRHQAAAVSASPVAVNLTSGGKDTKLEQSRRNATNRNGGSQSAGGLGAVRPAGHETPSAATPDAEYVDDGAGR